MSNSGNDPFVTMIGGLCLFLGTICLKLFKMPLTLTLDYGISMPAGINMPGGTFGKTNRRASWKINL